MSEDRPHAPIEASPALAASFCRGLRRPAEKGEMLHFHGGLLAGQMWVCTHGGRPGRWTRMVEVPMPDPPDDRPFELADVVGVHGGPMMEITIAPKPKPKGKR